MATYPSIMTASGSVKQSRINKVYATSAIKQTRQTKGPNMFKRMIRGLVTWSMRDNHQHQEEIAVPDDACRLSATGIRFEVYRANGGTVVETRRNDRRTGDSVYELHVISGDQDLGAEIGKIITLEALKS
jgi:hypothetical protein